MSSTLCIAYTFDAIFFCDSITAFDFDVVPDVNNKIFIAFSSIFADMYSLFPSSSNFCPSSFNVFISLYPASFDIQIYSFTFVLFLFFISSIFSMYFSSKYIASALLLINELSSSSICKSLSNGIDTIPPNRLVKCPSAHSYLFRPKMAILLFLNPILYNLVPNAFICSKSIL